MNIYRVKLKTYLLYIVYEIEITYYACLYDI